jgi:hypothetical protein
MFSFPEKDHQHLHVNANRLHVHYKIPLHTAYGIFKSCPVCAPLHWRSHPSGANPRGLCTNELWQMNVTHKSFYPQQPYLHVGIDTYSKFICVIPQCKENIHAIIASLLTMLCSYGSAL